MANDRIFELKREENVGVVRIDVPGQPVNTWTEEAIGSFGCLLEELEKEAGLKGVVFISAKPDNFHAGADLKLLNKMSDRNETVKALDKFHSLLNRVEALSFPTLAAIEGHCLGGGLEFALVCTARIAKETKRTQMGLPECSLGLLPGGGGTQRLPRLIGMRAIELILRGTVFAAADSFRMGIVDKLIAEKEDLLAEAKNFLCDIASGKEVIKRSCHDFSQIDQAAEAARQGVLKATRGREIPGPMLAIESMQEGLKVSLQQGLEIEKEKFVEAVLSNQAKGSIHAFLLKTMSDKPRLLMTSGFEPRRISKVAILGLGTMGRGIAIDVLRNAQVTVVAKDVPRALDPGKEFVRKILFGMEQKNKLKEPLKDIMNRLIVVADYGEQFQDVDLVIEAVFEDITVKEQVYGEICKVAPDSCIIVSNTSSIPLDAMSAFVTRPERFAGLHFFSPVWMMQLVEIVRGAQTSRQTIDNLLNFAEAIRKRPVVCNDNPGFVVNAVLFPYLLSAMEFLEAGNSVEEIDRAFVKFGMPVGPIRLTDEVGIDVCFNVLKGRGLRQDTLKNLVGAGRLGLKKSGKGFFLEDGTVDPEVLPLIARKGERRIKEEQMQSSVLTAMIKVGRELLDSGVVDDPRMVDIGMIWGTGFPADRGGPLKWADLTGLSEQLFGKPFYAK